MGDTVKIVFGTWGGDNNAQIADSNGSSGDDPHFTHFLGMLVEEDITAALAEVAASVASVGK